MIPITQIKYYDNADRQFIKFLTLLVILTVIEIAMIVFIPEEGGKLFPGKVCFRYLAIFFIPYLLMFLKCKKEYMKITKVTTIMYIVVGVYMFLFYIYSERGLTVIDGYFLLILEVLDTKWRASSIVILLIFAIITIIVINRNISRNNLANMYIKILIIVLVVILPINLIMPIYVSNIQRNGLETQNDYIEIAKYLKLDYDRVYAYCLPDYNFFGQVISDYIKIEEPKDLIIDTENQDIAIIVYYKFSGKIYGAEKADIDTKYFYVYVSDKESNNIRIISNS